MSVDLPEPLAPLTPTRSPRVSCRSTGPSRNAPRSTTAPRSTATTSPDGGAPATDMFSCHSLRGSSTGFEPLEQSFGLARLRCLLLRLLDPRLAPDLVVVALLPHRVPDAALGPGALRTSALGQRRDAVGVLVVRVAGLASRSFTLAQVRVVAAVDDEHPLLREVELDNAGDRAGEELTVVADEHDRDAQAADELLEPLQAVEVEVVGRFVQQQDVVTAEQQTGEREACRLATGQRGRGAVEVDREPELGDDLFGALVEIGASEGQPVVERGTVGVVRTPSPGGERVRCGVQGGMGSRDAGAAAQVVADGLTGAPVGFLGQVPDGRRSRVHLDRAGLRGDQPGQDLQQGGLTRPVGADQPDDVTGGDDQLEVGEEGAVAVAGGQVAGDDGCGHIR